MATDDLVKQLKEITDSEGLSRFLAEAGVSRPDAELLVQLRLLSAQEAGASATTKLISVEQEHHEEAARMAKATEDLATRTALMAYGTIALALLTFGLLVATIMSGG